METGSPGVSSYKSWPIPSTGGFDASPSMTCGRHSISPSTSDVLEMSAEISPLLKPLIERDELMIQAQFALESGDFPEAAQLFEGIAEKCFEIGDYSLSNEFYDKCEKLKQILVQQ